MFWNVNGEFYGSEFLIDRDSSAHFDERSWIVERTLVMVPFHWFHVGCGKGDADRVRLDCATRCAEESCIEVNGSINGEEVPDELRAGLDLKNWVKNCSNTHPRRLCISHIGLRISMEGRFQSPGELAGQIEPYGRAGQDGAAGIVAAIGMIEVGWGNVNW
jgi:hypothetical protein